MMTRRKMIWLAMTLALPACGIAETFMVGLWDGSEIMGTDPWYLVERNGSAVDGAMVTVQYENNNLVGNGFCNVYRVAPFHTSSKAIKIDNVAAMRTICTDDLMALEEEHFEALYATTSITVQEGKLLFQSDEGHNLLIFMQ